MISPSKIESKVKAIVEANDIAGAKRFLRSRMSMKQFQFQKRAAKIKAQRKARRINRNK